MRSLLAAAWLIALTSVANAQMVQYERIRLAIQKDQGADRNAAP
jgi:hypothetical protein